MNLIVCVDKNFGIGNNGELLFHIPEDMAFFKSKTIGKVVVMGKNTFLTLPDKKPLVDRVNIVLSSNAFSEQGVIHCSIIDDLHNLLKDYNTDDVFIIGGQEVYEKLLPYCKKAFLTKVNTEKQADRFFPNIDDMGNWELINTSKTQSYKELEFYFCEYINNEVQTLEKNEL